MKSSILKSACLIVAIAAATLLSSCSPFRNLPLADTGMLKGKSVARVVRPPAKVVGQTPGKALAEGLSMGIGGAIGGALAASVGSEDLAAKNGIADPAETASRNLTAALVKRHGMKRAGDVRTKSIRVSTLTKEAAGADYLLDVQTLG